jgi:diacylglycerol kinase (ATP)
LASGCGPRGRRWGRDEETIRRNSREAFAPLLEELGRRGRRCELVWTKSAEDGERQARKAAAEKVEVVVAAGGDGTLNEVARGLIGTQTAMGLVPDGTVNVLVRALGTGLHLKDAFDTLLGGAPRTFWPAEINGLPFLTIAGIGLDAAVIDATDVRLKERIGRIAYPLSGLMKYGRLKKPAITGGPLSRPASMVAVGRTPLYAGAYPLMPDADTFGRRFGLFALHGTRRLQILRALYAIVARGGRLPLENIRQISRGAGEHFLFKTETPCPFQVDGDYRGTAREFEIGVSKLPLRVWLPGE